MSRTANTRHRVRTLPPSLQQRAEGQTPTIIGYAAVFWNAADPGTEYRFGNYTEYRERIMPGAFDRALREDDVRALFNHDSSALLGRTSAGTLRLSVDGKGLRYEIDPPDTQAARDVLEAIRRGEITGSSFGFDPIDIGYQDLRENGRSVVVQEVRSLALFDVGPVTFPAYESTSAGTRAAEDLRGAVEAAAAWRAARSGPTPDQVAARARMVELGLGA